MVAPADARFDVQVGFDEAAIGSFRRAGEESLHGVAELLFGFRAHGCHFGPLEGELPHLGELRFEALGGGQRPSFCP